MVKDRENGSPFIPATVKTKKKVYRSWRTLVHKMVYREKHMAMERLAKKLKQQVLPCSLELRNTHTHRPTSLLTMKSTTDHKSPNKCNKLNQHVDQYMLPTEHFIHA